MKRTERHHLKENELRRLAREARHVFDTQRQTVSWLLAGLVLVAIAGVGYVAWREHVATSAGTLLADAMAVQEARIGPPPAPGTVSASPYFPTEGERLQASLVKFKAAADAYPSTEAGMFARYQQATTLLTMGNFADAAKAFQQVIDRGGDSIHVQMARVGLAEAQARAGQYDPAITTFKELSQRTDGPLPVDGILMQLGRVYLDAGQPNDAQQTFLRIVHEFPDSPFNGDAQRELDTLEKAKKT